MTRLVPALPLVPSLKRADYFTLQERCASYRWTQSNCRRSFSQEGHFENLLDVDDKQQYYGPFLTTRLTTVTNGDYHLLPPYSVLNRTSPDAVNGASLYALSPLEQA